MVLPTTVRVILRASRQWAANQDSRLGAALAYYTLFSIAPLLIIAIHIAGVFFEEKVARDTVVGQLKSMFGRESAEVIENLIKHSTQPSGAAPLVSLGLLIIGAVGIFLHVRSALCTIWKLTPPRGNTLLGILLDYFLALVMVVGTGALLLVSLAASMVLAILRKFLDDELPIGVPWELVELATSVLYLTLLFAVTFHILSGQRIAWKYVLYGSVVTALLFSVGKIALGMYLVYSSTASMYGAAGSLVVFLVWVYYSSQILFFGAELVQARRTRQEWMGQ